MSRGTLTGHGRMPWDRARELLAPYTCAWADLDGFHVSPAPTEAPLTTTLWAWRPGSFIRARIDVRDAILGQLDLPGDGVEVTVRRSKTWSPGEGRVGLAGQWRGKDVTLYEVAGLMPLTFVELP